MDWRKERLTKKERIETRIKAALGAIRKDCGPYYSNRAMRRAK